MAYLSEKLKDVLPVVRVSLSLADSIFGKDEVVRPRRNPQFRSRSGRTLEKRISLPWEIIDFVPATARR